MKKFFKWFGIVLGSLIGLIVLVFLGLMLKGNSMLNKNTMHRLKRSPSPPMTSKRGTG